MAVPQYGQCTVTLPRGCYSTGKATTRSSYLTGWTHSCADYDFVDLDFVAHLVIVLNPEIVDE